MSLDPEFKERWLAALRSGKYRPAPGFLRSEQGYCCLGVAADVWDPDKWSKELCWEYLGVTHYLPIEVTVSIGITKGQEGELAAINDDAWAAGETDFSSVIARIERM